MTEGHFIGLQFGKTHNLKLLNKKDVTANKWVNLLESDLLSPVCRNYIRVTMHWGIIYCIMNSFSTFENDLNILFNKNKLKILSIDNLCQKRKIINVCSIYLFSDNLKKNWFLIMIHFINETNSRIKGFLVNISKLSMIQFFKIESTCALYNLHDM